MATLTIEGKRVQVDDGFLSLPANEQQAAVDEIAAQIGIRPPQHQQQPTANADQQVSNIAAKGAAIPEDRVQPDLGRLAVTQGALLGGGDEIISAARVPVQAGLNAITGEGPTDPRELFEQNQAQEQAVLAATREAHPNAAFGAELAGSLATGGVGGAAAVSKAGNLLTKSMAGAGVGAGVGAAHGFNTGNDLDERLNQAQSGAATGAVVGAAFPGAAKVVGAAARRIAAPSARAAAKALNVSKSVVQRIQRGFDDSVNTGSLRKGDADEMLLDLSPQLRGQAEAISTQPGEGGQKILDAVFSRREGAGGRIQKALDKGLGTDVGRSTFKNITTQERKAAGAMYNAARKSDALFDMAPFRGQINEFADILVTQGDGNLRRFIEKLPEGAVDAKTLHFVRQNLDDEVSKATRAGQNNLKRALTEIRSSVDVELKTIPGWAKADAAFSLAKKREEAFDAGRGVFQRGYGSPDELAAELKGMPPKVKAAFVQGARDAVSTIMGTARNDAGAAIRELAEKGWNKEKLQIILGKGADKIIRTLEKEKRFADTLAALTGNSRTAMRQAAQKEFPNPSDRSVRTEQAAAGGVSGLAIRSAYKLADALMGGAMNRRNARISSEAAELLTRTGLDREQVVSTLNKLAREKGEALISERDSSDSCEFLSRSCRAFRQSYSQLRKKIIPSRGAIPFQP